MDAKQLEKMMGFAPGELEKAAEAYEKDEWPKGRTIKLGRPSISDEPSVVLSARVGESVLDAFDAKAKRHGQTRTERPQRAHHARCNDCLDSTPPPTQTCTPASKVDIFRHLWMLAYSFCMGSARVVVGDVLK